MADNDIMKNEIYTHQIGDMTTKGTQKVLHIIFIIDISGSMRFDRRIEAVNEAFTNMIPALREIQLKCRSDFELRIAIMTFDEDARWIVPPTPILEYVHEEIECSKWVTYYSRAFQVLGEKLTRKEYMAHTGKIAHPYIMFMTDGEPTENDPYQSELDALMQNRWFTESQRFAVLIGSDAINSASARTAVEGFVSNPTEGIINAADAAAIAAEVQANTIANVTKMTLHPVQAPVDESENGDFPGNDSGNSNSGDGGFFGDAGFDSDYDPFAEFDDNNRTFF